MGFNWGFKGLMYNIENIFEYYLRNCSNSTGYKTGFHRDVDEYLILL